MTSPNADQRRGGFPVVWWLFLAGGSSVGLIWSLATWGLASSRPRLILGIAASVFLLLLSLWRLRPPRYAEALRSIKAQPIRHRVAGAALGCLSAAALAQSYAPLVVGVALLCVAIPIGVVTRWESLAGIETPDADGRR